MKMRAPEGAVAALELEVVTKWLGESPLTSGILEPVRQLGEGTRRALRVLVRDMKVEVEPEAKPAIPGEQRSSVRVYFVLPKGAYATTVLEAAFALEEPPHAVRIRTRGAERRKRTRLKPAEVNRGTRDTR
jgi:tRNA(Glu) U13 pseudouridine synthase TruD